MAPMLHAPHSDGRAMLDLIDHLRQLSSVCDNIPLPQIIVIGQQSSGKSSVLNAISGLDFPTGGGVVTRFATEIVLRRAETSSRRAYIKYDQHPSVTTPEQKARFDQFSREWPSSRLLGLKQFNEVFDTAKKALRISDNTLFYPQSLVIEIEGPEQEHLTLIDLPGFVLDSYTDLDHISIDDMELCIDNYMKNERSIIMAVFTAASDFVTQMTMKKIRKKKPNYSERTLGIITHLDRIQNFGKNEELINLVEHNEKLPLGYGWHVVRNLSDKQKAKRMDPAVVENDFFEKDPEWKKLPPQFKGVPALRTSLSRILRQRISGSLPDITTEIEAKLKICNNELTRLGDARNTSTEQRKYLFRVAEKFAGAVDGALNGRASLSGFGSDKDSLQTRIRKLGEDFALTIAEKGSTWVIDRTRKPVSNLSDERLQQAKLAMDGEATGQIILSEQEAVEGARWLVETRRGRQLPFMVDFDWVAILFQKQSEGWHKIAAQYIDEAYLTVYDFLKDVINEITSGDTKDKLLGYVLNPAMETLKLSLDKKLEELLSPFRRNHVFMLTRSLSAHRQRIAKARTEALDATEAQTEIHAGCQILNMVDTFYDIALEIFTANVDALAVENCFLAKLTAIFNTGAVLDMSSTRLQTLGGESSTNEKERASQLKKKSQYIAALSLIDKHRYGPHLSLEEVSLHIGEGEEYNTQQTRNDPYVQVAHDSIKESIDSDAELDEMANLAPQTPSERLEGLLPHEPWKQTLNKLSSRRTRSRLHRSPSAEPRTPERIPRDRSTSRSPSSPVTSPHHSEFTDTPASSIASTSPKYVKSSEYKVPGNRIDTIESPTSIRIEERETSTTIEV